jgi:uncharacterized protein YjbI with pentapeptide repeats
MTARRTRGRGESYSACCAWAWSTLGEDVRVPLSLAPMCTYRPCPGRARPGHRACFGHMQESERQRDLTEALRDPDAPADILRRSTVTWEILDEVLAAVGDQGVVARTFDARGAVFASSLSLVGLTFSRRVLFTDIICEKGLDLSGSTLMGGLSLQGARLSESVKLSNTTVKNSLEADGVEIDGNLTIRHSRLHSVRFANLAIAGTATVSHSTFLRGTTFRSAKFAGRVSFSDCNFGGTTSFSNVEAPALLELRACLFAWNVSFAEAKVGRLAIEKLTSKGTIAMERLQVSGTAGVDMRAKKNISRLNSVWQDSSITLETTHSALLQRTRFHEYVSLDVRLARTSAEGAIFQKGLALVQTGGQASLNKAQLRAASLLKGVDQAVLLSLEQVQFSACELSGFDLSRTRWSGATGLDALRWSGDASLWPVPSVWRTFLQASLAVRGKQYAPPARMSRRARRSIADEWDWRQETRGGIRWKLPERLRSPQNSPEPSDLARLYRNLRKGREALGDHAGGGEYYYSEMEMRRLAAPFLSLERFLLAAYRLVSGYGLRVARPLIGLALVTGLLAIGYQNVGFVDPEQPYATTSSAAATETEPCAQETPVPDICFPSATAVVYAAGNLVSLPGDSPNLSLAGHSLRLLGRVTGPALLALLALAIRNRLRR